ncbi:MAG: response regulator [Sulfurimonas sp.]|nr:response regulator [Sulfurimonas sp.]
MDYQKVSEYTKKLSVLYVEDDVDLLEETTGFLEDLFYRVDTAKNGLIAFNKYNEYKDRESKFYDIIITDINMPVMDGMDLIRDIHSINKIQPVIVVSAYSEATKLIQMIQSGVSNFLLKPINPEELMTMLYKMSKDIINEIDVKKYKADLEDLNANLESRVVDLSEEVLYTQQLSIEMISNLIENHDGDIKTHSKRIEKYTIAILDELKETVGIDEELADMIPISALLHDIGELMLPNGILTKPSSLNEEETTIMRRHAQMGSEILKEANETFKKHFNKDSYMKVASDIAMYHHEKWNGLGYPEGLSGEDIPIAARIVAIADVYDALRSLRVYKEAFTHEEATRQIVEESGKSFDPNLVNIFLHKNQEFKKIFDTLS